MNNGFKMTNPMGSMATKNVTQKTKPYEVIGTMTDEKPSTNKMLSPADSNTSSSPNKFGLLGMMNPMRMMGRMPKFMRKFMGRRRGIFGGMMGRMRGMMGARMASMGRRNAMMRSRMQAMGTGQMGPPGMNMPNPEVMARQKAAMEAQNMNA